MLGRILANLAGRRKPQPAAAVRPPLYLVGYPGFLFERFAARIASLTPVAAVISDSAAGDGLGWYVASGVVPFIGFDEFAARARAEPVMLAHFFDALDQYRPLENLDLAPGSAILDFLELQVMLGLPHTYVSMAEERDYALGSADVYASLNDRFADRRSRDTLAARIEALQRGDRQALLRARFGADSEYFAAGDPEASLVIRENEVYVDIGAADGDTLERFIAASGGRFAAIHAFEPTPAQCEALRGRAGDDPRIHIHPNAVGEVNGSIPFHDDAGNPFGSNALSLDPDRTIMVECVRLDDVIEGCTLLKMDVEGYETRVVRGAARLIAESRPNLAITCYHYPQDMAEIVSEVLRIHAYRHVALRHYGPTLYDTVLLFSDRQSFDAAGAC